MAGYGYTRIVGRGSITADVLGGYAFGSIGLSGAAADAYGRTPGAGSVTARATNTLVMKPEIGFWYDMTRRLYLNVNAGYMVARPEVTVDTSLGLDIRKARADQFILKAGIVYSVF
jgi:hypothetical protein